MVVSINLAAFFISLFQMEWVTCLPSAWGAEGCVGKSKGLLLINDKYYLPSTTIKIPEFCHEC
jgi:hypothetical protein